MIRIALIGAGRMSEVYSRALQQNKRFSICGICDLNYELAQKNASLYGGVAYKDYKEMIKEQKPDAVIVVTPDHLHFEPVLDCAKAGIPMIIEKPLCTDLEEGKKMVEAVEKYGIKTQMAHIFRWIPHYIAVKKAIETGELGQPISATVQVHDRIFVPTKMLRWSASTSPSWFLLAHVVDCLRWQTGLEVKSVFARGTKKKLLSMGIDTYDTVMTQVMFANGFCAALEANWIVPDTLPTMAGVWYHITGTEGSMHLNTFDQGIHKVGKEFEHSAHINFVTDDGRFVGVHRNMLDSFGICLSENKPTLATIYDGYRTMCVLNMIDKAMVTGREMDVEY